jgi:polysaccharide pyruvyl transferase WcaK-like protein
VKSFVTGWYGYGNIGDELLSVSAYKMFLDAFGVPPTMASVNPEITAENITAMIPEATPRVARWPRSAKLKDMASAGIIRTSAAIMGADCVAIGGGGMLSDWKGSKVHRWLDFISLCKKLGKRTILAGIGAGPFFDKTIAERIGKTINNDVDLIIARDAASKAYLERDAGVTREIELSVDLVFYIWEAIRENQSMKRDVVAANFVPFQDLGNQYEDNIVALLKETTRERTVELVPFHTSDLEFHEQISQRVDSPNLRALPLKNIKETIQILSASEVALLTRFHSIILGAMLGVPMVPVVYHHKSAELVSKMQMDRFAVDIGDGTQWKSNIPTPSDLQRRLEQVMVNAKTISSQLTAVAQEQHRKASEYVEKLRSVMR